MDGGIIWLHQCIDGNWTIHSQTASCVTMEKLIRTIDVLDCYFHSGHWFVLLSWFIRGTTLFLGQRHYVFLLTNQWPVTDALWGDGWNWHEKKRRRFSSFISFKERLALSLLARRKPSGHRILQNMQPCICSTRVSFYFGKCAAARPWLNHQRANAN